MVSELHTPDTGPDGFDRTFAVIRDALADHLASSGAELQSCKFENAVARPYSTVTFFRAHDGRQLQHLVAKTTTRHTDNIHLVERDNQAIVEYDALQKLYNAFRDFAGCSVPQPLIVIPEIDTYVMHFVEGDELANHSRYSRYGASREKFHSLKNHYHLCGRWLRHFQQTTGIHMETAPSLKSVVQRCSVLADRIDRENRTPRLRKLLGRVTCDVERDAAQLSDTPILSCGRHGDFGPWNVMASDQGITVIDFFGFEPAPLPIDLLRMLVFLDDEKRCLTNSGKRVAALRDRFLTGYGPLPSVAAPLVRICETQQRLISLVDAHVRRRSSTLHHRAAAHLCIKAHLAWLRDPINQNSLWPFASDREVN